MPKFSQSSEKQLDTCVWQLQYILKEAIKCTDFTVIEGHRGKEAQNKAFADGNSKLQWPDGKHNELPSRAVDIAPYPIDWGTTLHKKARFYYLAGVIFRVFYELQAEGLITSDCMLRWGGDWDGDKDFQTKPLTI